MISILKYYNSLKKNLRKKYSFLFLNLCNSDLKNEYLKWIFEQNKKKSETYVSYTENNIQYNEKMPKLISFYLPQYYENECNNKYFGKGFMEWYNVTKAIPQYTGHYQPHLPIDVGFYNLTHDDIMYRQIELARKYGIYGFCFYYYWFSGQTLLEKPIRNFLNNKDLNMPFCLMWTNETWTNVWGDGNHKKIIKQQELLDDDYLKFANDVILYFKDERYIKINGKPLLIIYQSQLFEKEKFIRFIRLLKENISKNGFDDIYIMTTNAKITNQDLSEYDIEGVIEFSHQTLPIQKAVCEIKNRFINPNFMGKIIDVKKALSNNLHLQENSYKTYKESDE